MSPTADSEPTFVAGVLMVGVVVVMVQIGTNIRGFLPGLSSCIGCDVAAEVAGLCGDVKMARLLLSSSVIDPHSCREVLVCANC